MIGHALRETVHGVKGMTGVRCGHDPLVMRFMQRLVNLRMVQASVYPVDAEVGKADEQGKL